MRLKRKDLVRSFDESKQAISYAFDKTVCFFGKVIYVLSTIAFIVSLYNGDHTTALLLITAAGVYLNLVNDLEKEMDIKYRFK